MEESFRKIPNWLRYILAIPFGLLTVILFYIVITISNLLFSDPNSLFTIISNFIFTNGVNVIIFFYGLNIMLPQRKFVITLTISILIGIAYSILQGMSIILNTLCFEYVLAYILFIISLIISCYLSYKDKFEAD